MNFAYKRIMIFGRPGSGKSTFAVFISKKLGIPVHHLDKHFFIQDWVERNYDDFLDIQQKIVDNDSWIVDGNCIRSLEMRFSKADLVLYFNFSRFMCFFRILKRFLKPNRFIKDKAEGCNEAIKISFVKYMLNFEKRVNYQIVFFKEKYPFVVFIEIKNNMDLNKLKEDTFKCFVGNKI